MRRPHGPGASRRRRRQGRRQRFLHPAAALDNSTLLSLPGSKLSFTRAQIANPFGPADWFPDDHPTMPDVVAHGRQSAQPQIWARHGECSRSSPRGRRPRGLGGDGRENLLLLLLRRLRSRGTAEVEWMMRCRMAVGRSRCCRQGRRQAVPGCAALMDTRLSLPGSELIVLPCVDTANLFGLEARCRVPRLQHPTTPDVVAHGMPSRPESRHARDRQHRNAKGTPRKRKRRGTCI